jgi:hypothetical protein
VPPIEVDAQGINHASADSTSVHESFFYTVFSNCFITLQHKYGENIWRLRDILVTAPQKSMVYWLIQKGDCYYERLFSRSLVIRKLEQYRGQFPAPDLLHRDCFLAWNNQ